MMTLAFTLFFISLSLSLFALFCAHKAAQCMGKTLWEVIKS